MLWTDVRALPNQARFTSHVQCHVFAGGEELDAKDDSEEQFISAWNAFGVSLIFVRYQGRPFTQTFPGIDQELQDRALAAHAREQRSLAEWLSFSDI